MLMTKVMIYIMIVLLSQQAWAQNKAATSSKNITDSVYWVQITTDSGVIHAAVVTPKGAGPFPAIVILHGTHGFAEEYVQMARQIAKNGIMSIAACWFAGRRGHGTRFITPIDFNDAPPLIDAPGTDRFRIARQTIDSLVQKIRTFSNVRLGSLMIFGHSRGAGAALDYVLTHPGKVKGAILNSGGYPQEVIKRASEIEIPILILHGIADSPADGGSAFTDISMTRQFEAALRTANKNVEVKYYEGGSHNSIFNNQAQFDDTIQRISDFLRYKLN
jgi:dienelactone hydrolase